MPKLNVSGYRGIWGTDLNEQIAFLYGLAFAKMVKNHGGTKILIGRDARKTGPLILEALKQAFEKEGLVFEYAGILPTPSMLLLIKKLSFDGGVMITASHNPPEYNGLKFINGSGLFTTPEETEEIIKNKENLQNETYSPVLGNKENTDNSKYRKIHIDEILKNIDVALIKSKKFKVAHDPINSTGSIITKELLEELGCEVFQINQEMNGEFAHMPEPLQKNLGQISELAKINKVDVGFAQDPDADRLVIINEKGEILNEEYTLALAVKSVLSKESGDIVVNMSTSRMSEDIAQSYNLNTYKSKVGEPNVVRKMEEQKAIIGGEGGGGVIYPKINTARDSLVGIALTLLLLAREDKTLSLIVSTLPKYFMKKDKWSIEGKDLKEIISKLKIRFADAKIDEQDGIRLDFANNSWIHLRASNTEPILRLFGEAKEENTIDALFEQAKLTLEAE